MNLADALAQGVLLLDGANGTRLAELGYEHLPYDLACFQAPDLVEQVHREYVDAGADAIETNTFSANRFRMDPLDHDPVALAEEGARIAKRAAGDRAFVLGAIGPCGKPIEPLGYITRDEATLAFREIAEALARGGVDGFFLETFTDLCEMELAVEAIRAFSDMPILASKAYIEDGEMLAEGLPARCTEEMEAWGVSALGANCIVGPQRMLDLVRMMAEATTLPILALPTPGLPQLVKGHIAYDSSPEYFAKACARLVEEGATIVGGCCGTTPTHIAALRVLIDAGIKTRKRTTAVLREAKAEELTQTEPSELAQKLGRKFVVAVEMDVPRGLNLDKLLAGARQLKIAGADVINISDGARARLRMNPAAVCALVQSRVGIEVTMHFSCRDRNLLAIQSDLLGCHATGIRNILAVTGDPATIGDYPSATSVFDIDAIGLCRVLKRFNDGLDLAGYGVGVKCGFTIACAYNPNAMDQAEEDDRLRRKADAGAQVIYTQPVFDSGSLQKSIAMAAEVGLPVLVGLMPLKSSRHAEFMHNEVPGVRVPQELRDGLARASDDAEGLEIGIASAIELRAEIAHGAQGLYLMPPFGNAAIAARVLGDPGLPRSLESAR